MSWESPERRAALQDALVAACVYITVSELVEPETAAGKSYRAKLRVKDKDNPRKPLAQDKDTNE